MTGEVPRTNVPAAVCTARRACIKSEPARCFGAFETGSRDSIGMVLPDPNTPVDLPGAGDAHVQDVVPRDALLFKEVLRQRNQPFHYHDSLLMPQDQTRRERRTTERGYKSQARTGGRGTTGPCCTAAGRPLSSQGSKR